MQKNKKVEDSKKEAGVVGEERERKRDISYFTWKLGCYEEHTTLFFFRISLTAIALNYRGFFSIFFFLFVKSEKEMNQKFI